MTFDRVRALRCTVTCDEADFACLLGVDRRTVRRWESGESSPSGAPLRMLLVLEDALRSDPSLAERLQSSIVRGGLAWILICAIEGRKL